MRYLVIGYVPVIHKGYLELFGKYGGENSFLFVFGKEIINSFRHLRKDVRALNPETIVTMAEALSIFGYVGVANSGTFEDIPEEVKIIMPDEDISREVARKYLPEHEITFSPIFLRWDKDRAEKKHKVDYDYSISYDRMVEEILDSACKEAEKSSDWWRHVGAVAVKKGFIIASAYNHHLPSEHTPYIVGDPRGEFHKGIHIELSSAIHAEAALIAKMAEIGISLSGADLYVTTFPCPPCAKLIGYSGIKRVFFHEGYAMLDAKDILKSFGVKTFYVKK